MKFSPAVGVVKRVIHREYPIMLAVAFIATLLGIMLSAGYVYTHETGFLSYPNRPLPVRVYEVPQGTPVSLDVVRCNSRSSSKIFKITHSLINVKTKEVIMLPEIESVAYPGCIKNISELNVVPSTAPLGTYIVHGISITQGHFREHTAEWTSDPFKVIAAVK